MENRRSEGKLVTLQFCTAASNIPAGTPLGCNTATNMLYTLGNATTGFAFTGSLGNYFIGVSDQNLSAGQSPVTIWTDGVFEFTAASAWTTAPVGVPVMADSGRVVTNTGISGDAPLGSYIPAGTGERSGSTVFVNIKPVMWRWSTYNVISNATSGGIFGDVFPRNL